MYRANLITALTVCMWSLKCTAPQTENPSNLALLLGLRLQQREKVEGTGSESDFERQWLHHNLTLTRLCLHDCLFCAISSAKERKIIYCRPIKIRQNPCPKVWSGGKLWCFDGFSVVCCDLAYCQ